AAEIGAMLRPRGWDVVPLVLTVDEDAPTFVGNAEKKARAALAELGLPSLADDSGLEVDALDGAPGVLSARFAGEPSNDGANNRKLVAALDGVPDARRTARFRCALVFVDADGARLVAEGACEGRIGHAPRGSGGFGYDPLFFVDGDAAGRTMAELLPDEKNRISHRARALDQLVRALDERFGHAR
ncbi:MAG: RdgB/HAM1 family non-canonical purine NTP pyrophosphatase, partial [Myxococcales bacterium]|nr:RdgB/HAM1 family non-canonical purine NTP pyrophosphatase [Myxococcales bacterium]